MGAVGVRGHRHLEELDVAPRGVGVDARSQLQLRSDWHCLEKNIVLFCNRKNPLPHINLAVIGTYRGKAPESVFALGLFPRRLLDL